MMARASSKIVKRSCIPDALDPALEPIEKGTKPLWSSVFLKGKVLRVVWWWPLASRLKSESLETFCERAMVKVGTDC